MPFVQTTYGAQQRAGYAGLVVNMETQNSKTRIIEDNTGVVGFGVPMFQGVADKGVLLPGSVAITGAGSAKAGNTGNGTITAVPPMGIGSVEGRYTLVAESATAFRMESPTGIYLGTVAVGTPTTLSGVGPFTITAGGTAFVPGDAFYIDGSTATGGTAFQGVTIADPTLVRREGETVDTFRKGDSAAILTRGVIWGVSTGGVLAGEPAWFNPTTKQWVAANTAGAVRIPNCIFDTSGAASPDLVQVRVSHL